MYQEWFKILRSSGLTCKLVGSHPCLPYFMTGSFINEPFSHLFETCLLAWPFEATIRKVGNLVTTLETSSGFIYKTGLETGKARWPVASARLACCSHGLDASTRPKSSSNKKKWSLSLGETPVRVLLKSAASESRLPVASSLTRRPPSRLCKRGVCCMISSLMYETIKEMM